ncbi:MAG: polysaccharide deacetylase family protein [Firmicutes bacterium]|nr:polysaccharide deacetylase family protein [Bacillota bacterium]
MKKVKVSIFIAIFLVLILSTVVLGGNVVASAYLDKEEDAQKKGTPLIILMYHELSDRKCSEHILSPATFEADIKYLSDNGYTSILMQDIINFVENGTPLPAKPVMITFDDGGKTDYTKAYPILKKYNTKAVFSVVGHYLERMYNEDGELNGVYVNSTTYAMLREMLDSGLIEVANHTYRLHSLEGRKGLKNKSREKYEDYKIVLENDLKKLDGLLEKKLGIVPSTIAFPYGAYSKDTLKIIKELGYKASLTCNEGINYITPETNLYLLKRYNRNPNRSIQKLFEKIT